MWYFILYLLTLLNTGSLTEGMNALLGAWFEQRKPSLYYLMKMKKFYSITQNSILFPVSLNYIENRRVLHFGIILDTA